MEAYKDQQDSNESTRPTASGDLESHPEKETEMRNFGKIVFSAKPSTKSFIIFTINIALTNSLLLPEVDLQ